MPSQFAEDLDESYRCMKGTSAKHHPKCVGLAGRIGKDAHCSIYEIRPTPCRAFKASFEDGIRNERCDDARRSHGLPPLHPSDFPGGVSAPDIDAELSEP